jgi:lysophospholipase L1-like esterase
MPTIVCYGDSNTHGYDPATMGRFPRGVRWPRVLAAELGGIAEVGAGFEVIEEGLNGRTTMWDDPYLDGRNGRTYLLPCLRSHTPVDILVLMLGTNDTKTIFGRSAAEIAAGVAALVGLALTSGTGPDGGAPRVLLIAPPGPGEVTARSEVWGFGEARAKGERMPALYRTVAEMNGVAFLDGSSIAELDPADGVHLTVQGHAILGRAVAEAVRGLL